MVKQAIDLDQANKYEEAYRVSQTELVARIIASNTPDVAVQECPRLL